MRVEVGENVIFSSEVSTGPEGAGTNVRHGVVFARDVYWDDGRCFSSSLTKGEEPEETGSRNRLGTITFVTPRNRGGVVTERADMFEVKVLDREF